MKVPGQTAALQALLIVGVFRGVHAHCMACSAAVLHTAGLDLPGYAYHLGITILVFTPQHVYG